MLHRARGQPQELHPMSELVGIYPGSFDPVHLGHVDLVRRASRLADRLVVGVLDNSAKNCLFSVPERVALLSEAVAGIPNVEVATFSGLLMDFARARGARVVVRGLRAVADFEYEFQMALMNRQLDAEVETVFLMPSVDYTYLSSRLVKEVARLGANVDSLVPPSVSSALRRKRADLP
jgi:pantetheine-phosphate adenylyltransferase